MKKKKRKMKENSGHNLSVKSWDKAGAEDGGSELTQ